MPKEYKTLTYQDNVAGRKQMGHDIDRLASEGWEVKSKESVSQGWSGGKTACLGCLFLPLALLGKKDNIIQVIMEREKSPNDQSGSALGKQGIAPDTSKVL